MKNYLEAFLFLVGQGVQLTALFGVLYVTLNKTMLYRRAIYFGFGMTGASALRYLLNRSTPSWVPSASVLASLGMAVMLTFIFWSYFTLRSSNGLPRPLSIQQMHSRRTLLLRMGILLAVVLVAGSAAVFREVTEKGRQTDVEAIRTVQELNTEIRSLSEQINVLRQSMVSLQQLETLAATERKGIRENLKEINSMINPKQLKTLFRQNRAPAPIIVAPVAPTFRFLPANPALPQIDTKPIKVKTRKGGKNSVRVFEETAWPTDSAAITKHND